MKQALMVFHLGNFINFELNDIKLLTKLGYKVSVATNFNGFEYLKEKLKTYNTTNYQIDFDRFP
ncbi:MAG: glycosyltransferase family 1 protein, partial [Elusimicrobia bacterium]|nr:glycosyltransferase family 1 protein [Elusimicrobiota bacterium]